LIAIGYTMVYGIIRHDQFCPWRDFISIIAFLVLGLIGGPMVRSRSFC
jgi:hypothetical protein